MILYLFFSSMLLLANPQVLIEGVVVAVAEKTITLKQEQGALVKIPRSSLATQKGILVGKDKVRVLVKPSDFMQLNPKAFSKKKQKKSAL